MKFQFAMLASADSIITFGKKIIVNQINNE